MIPAQDDPTPPSHPLAALLPPNRDLAGICSPETLHRLEQHLARLVAMGFELEARDGNLWVRHGNRGFDTVLEVTPSDDMAQRRRLFSALKTVFGGFWDRFTLVLQPSGAVTAPYESLKAILEICQGVQRKASWAP